VFAVSSGPIEFLQDEPNQSVPSTEYGGGDGLIQARWPGGVEGEGLEGHLQTSGEVAGIRTRRGIEALDRHRGWTGVDDSDEIIDPVTGLASDDELVSGDVTGNGGALSDLKPTD
jgi:hypothetical protein